MSNKELMQVKMAMVKMALDEALSGEDLDLAARIEFLEEVQEEVQERLDAFYDEEDGEDFDDDY